jgi:hypothetical protein
MESKLDRVQARLESGVHREVWVSSTLLSAKVWVSSWHLPFRSSCFIENRHQLLRSRPSFGDIHQNLFLETESLVEVSPAATRCVPKGMAFDSSSLR